jgi:hypothetical protein
VPWSVMESQVRSGNGTRLGPCAAAAAVRGGVVPGLLAEGLKWYSMSVNRPSGGRKGSAFDCAKRSNLCGRLGWSTGRRAEYEPDTGMEGQVSDGV